MALAWLLLVAGWGALFVPVWASLPDLPVFVPFVLMAAGAVVALVAWRRGRGTEPSRKRTWSAGAVVILAAFTAAWFFAYTPYAPPRELVRTGDHAPHVVADRVRDGARFELVRQRGNRLLLVFFRGAW